MASKTGKIIRQACPEIDVIKLTTNFDDWVANHSELSDVFNFGVYDAISRSMACSASGLHQNSSFLLMLLKLAPWGQINPAILRSCFLRHPTKNYSTLRTDLWAGGRAESVTTMLNHVRRLKDSQDRLRQALSKATPAEIKSVKALLKASLSDEYESDVERQLTSHVSVDSDGYPAMLASQPDVADKDQISSRGLKDSPKTRLKSKTSDPAALAIFSAALQQAAASAKVLAIGEVRNLPLKRPAAAPLKRPAAAGSSKSGKIKTQPDAASEDDKFSLVWGPLSLTMATQQSYIQFKESGGKKKLLIAVSKGAADNCGKHHHDIIKLLLEKAKEASVSLEDLKAYRSELLS